MGEIQEALRRAKLARIAGAAAAAADPEPRERLAPTILPPAPPPPSRRPPPTVHLSHERRGRWTARGLLVEDSGAKPELLRHLAVRVRRELRARNARTLAVVSAHREEGKTTTSCNLALALASLEPVRSIALVDLDLRNPSVGTGLDLSPAAGIDDVLLGRSELAAACVEVDEPLLDVYPTRRPQPRAHQILAQPSLAATLRALERRYEIVVLDTPPVLLVPDASVILETAAAAVAVVRARRSTRRAFETLCSLLPAGRLLGAILNEGQPLPGADRYGYGYYGSQPERAADEADASV